MEKIKRMGRALLGIALAIALVAVPMADISYKVDAAADSNVQSMENEISQLQAEQDRLQGLINSLDGESAQISEQKMYLDSMVSTTAQKIILTEELVAELETKIAETEAEIAETEAAMAETYDKMIARLRYAQENGNIGELEMLLDSTGLVDFLTRLDKVNAMLDYDVQVMRDYESQKLELEEQRDSLESSRETQVAALAQLEEDKDSYQAASAQSEQLMSSLEADKAAYEAEYAAAKAAEDALNEELEAYIQKTQEQSQVVPSGDGFMFPLPHPSQINGYCYISSHFGWRELWGSWDLHEATDIACPQGVPIYAADSGKVIRAEWHWSYGYYVIIDHGGGMSTLYAHATTLLVSVGQTVNKGDTIATVGTTGSSTGYHLHLEVRVNGVRVDPELYVPMPF